MKKQIKSKLDINNLPQEYQKMLIAIAFGDYENEMFNTGWGKKHRNHLMMIHTLRTEGYLDDNDNLTSKAEDAIEEDLAELGFYE